MVLKGQIFSLDMSFAFFVICIILSVAITQNWLVAEGAVSKYETFEKQKKLFDASEFLVTSKTGLAKREHEENSVKHHELNLSKLGEVSSMDLLLSDYESCITLKTRSGNEWLGGCEHSGTKITRFAICEDELCVLEISAE